MDVKVADWSNSAKIDTMSVVNANGDTRVPLSVFYGKKMSYRPVLITCAIENESYASYLSFGAVMTMREKFLELILPISNTSLRRLWIPYETYWLLGENTPGLCGVSCLCVYTGFGVLLRERDECICQPNIVIQYFFLYSRES